MLTKFSVSNFKSFHNEFTINLKDSKGYSFNDSCIKNGIINNAIIYGPNGIGKSNFGFAIFDIIGHLTDKISANIYYSYFLNALNDSINDFAKFHYEFLINGSNITYEYQKKDYNTIKYERFLINGNELAFIDRNTSDEAIIRFKGAESLNRNLTNEKLSLLKYIKNNSILDSNNQDNDCFVKFFEFINGMLFFRSLNEKEFLGLEAESSDIIQDIIEHENTTDFEQFLNRAGIECEIKIVKELDKKSLAFSFNDRTIPFYLNASHGTRSLTLFYFWFQRIKELKVPFLFIDEFDAFYHFKLSNLIVQELKRIGLQFILTTHDTSIMTNDLLRPDCYFIMSKSSIKSLPNCTQKELREAHNLEKMFKSHSFDE